MVEDDDLEGLSQELGDAWEALARRLGFKGAEIQGLKHNNQSYPKIQLCMLQEWKERLGRNATYQALCDALCHVYVNCKGLSEMFRINNNYAPETSTGFNSSARVGMTSIVFIFLLFDFTLFFLGVNWKRY